MGGIIALFIVLNLTINTMKKPEVSDTDTTVVKKVEDASSGWWVNDKFIDKKDKEGFFSPNPEMGDSMDFKLNNNGHVVGWQVIDEK